jgi:hypothetical protein
MAEAAPKQTNPACLNQAYIFIKPHACHDDAALKNVTTLVEEKLKKEGFSISPDCCGKVISAKEIDEGKLIDTHYYAIASKATLKKPNELNIPKDKFKDKFGVEWDDVLAKGLAYNAVDGAKKLGDLDAFQLEAKWRETKKAKTMIKFGGGFYCALIEGIYVFNGFFMSMKNAYVKPGNRIVAYSVTWDQNNCSWEDFRCKVLGPTDPTKAPKDSIRGMIFADWEKLGLAEQPNTGDNGVHASASPFEGLAEHMNWLGMSPKKCVFGQTMLSTGIAMKTIAEWSVDPQLIISPSGERGSCFDAMEDQNALDCIATAVKLELLNC